MTIRGELQDLHLENLIHIICTEKRTTVLKLDRQEERGLIYFDQGDVVHALSSKYMVGVEAFYSFLSWSTGKFELQQGIPAPRKSISMSCAKLLLNGMEKLDTKKDQDAAKIRKQLSPQEVMRDSSLENDLIVLISTLERSQTRILDLMNSKKTEQMVNGLAEMINEIAAVVEKFKDMIIESDPLGNFLTLVGHNCPAARYFKVVANRIITDSCLGLYKALKKDKAAQQQFLDEIKESLLYVMTSNYQHLLTSFHNPDLQHQWKEAGKDLFSGLRAALNLENN